MLPLKKIILIQQAMGEAPSKLNANFFSDVIDAQTISEIGREEYTQYDRKVKMKSSSSEITIYALLATSVQDGLTFKFDEIEYWLPSQGDLLITVLLSKHDTEGRLVSVTIKKGFKVTLKVGEEGKALAILQRIVDRLYRQEMGVNVEKTIESMRVEDVGTDKSMGFLMRILLISIIFSIQLCKKFLYQCFRSHP